MHRRIIKYFMSQVNDIINLGELIFSYYLVELGIGSDRLLDGDAWKYSDRRIIMKYLSKGLVFLVHFNLGQVD